MLHIGEYSNYPITTVSTTTTFLAAIASGEKRIYLGEGTYNLTSAISIPADTIIYGDGDNTVINWNSASAVSAFITLASSSILSSVKVTNTGGGTITNGILLSSSYSNLKNITVTNLPVTISGDDNIVDNCYFSGSSGIITISGDYNKATKNKFIQLGTGIYITGDKNTATDNTFRGNANSDYGVYLSSTSAFNIVLGNEIEDITGTPGHGIFLDTTGGSNLVSSNIFARYFGGVTVYALVSVSSTNQAISNHSYDVISTGARITSVYLGGMSGFLNN